jgi:predicted dehydrogenase
MKERFLIVGLGSMGKRRLRNLLDLGYSDIIGYDMRIDRTKEVSKQYKIKTVTNFQEALYFKPTTMIISSPPNLHNKYVKIAIKNGINFFTELNLLSNEVKKIIDLMKYSSVIGKPSCSMKFHPMVLELKKLLKKNLIGNICVIHHHSGFSLPLWHPWENHNDFFASKKLTGGARELFPVDLIWIVSLFSEISSVFGNVTKISNLDAKIDDIYNAMFEFKNGIICNYITDVITNPPSKTTKIIGEKGTILCDFKTGEILLLKEKTRKKIKVKMGSTARGYVGTTPPESLYFEETKNFVNSLKGKLYPFSFVDELNILKILDTTEHSSKLHRRLNLN